MNKRDEVLEIFFKYDRHLFSFMVNFKSIEDFRKSVEYRLFCAEYGDILVVNKRDDNKNLIVPHATITLSISEECPTKKTLREILYKVVSLLIIPFYYTQKISKEFTDSFETVGKKKVLCHSVLVINKYNIQEIILDMTTYKSKWDGRYHYTSDVEQTDI